MNKSQEILEILETRYFTTSVRAGIQAVLHTLKDKNADSTDDLELVDALGDLATDDGINLDDHVKFISWLMTNGMSKMTALEFISQWSR